MKKNIINLTNQLRAIRQATGLKQIELAVMARIAPGTLSRIECYPMPVTQATANKLAEALNVKATEIFPYLAAKPKLISNRPKVRA